MNDDILQLFGVAMSQLKRRGLILQVSAPKTSKSSSTSSTEVSEFKRTSAIGNNNGSSDEWYEVFSIDRHIKPLIAEFIHSRTSPSQTNVTSVVPISLSQLQTMVRSRYEDVDLTMVHGACSYLESEGAIKRLTSSTTSTSSSYSWTYGHVLPLPSSITRTLS
jgi:hypothetical protein